MLKIFKKFILISLLLLIILFIIYIKIINSSAKTGDDYEFVITKGQSVSIIAQNLKTEKLINSELFFKIYIKLSGKQADFKEGSYTLNPKMSIKQITTELTPKVFLKPDERITFIEGWNLKNYNEALANSSLIDVSDFLSATKKDYSDKFSFLKDKPKKTDLEGYLFPDTYRFYTDITGEEVVIKMLSNFDNKLSAQMRDDISNQGKTISEIITMASIIEKEVRSTEDMKIVSGIFWNRIKGGQALESCATLAYILGVNKEQYTFEDTRTDSPFNTYINRGLPPSPISNPGLKAIEAAIYPEDTNYNYFLTSSNGGQTVFSRTYEEHLNNKNKYIK